MGYDIDNLRDPALRKSYRGEVTTDRYGRAVPKHAHGTANLPGCTASTRQIIQASLALFDRIMDKNLLSRRIYLTANRVVSESDASQADAPQQLDLFTDYAAQQAQRELEARQLEKERSIQEAVLSIKKKYGKNAILKGMNLEEGATARDRNGRIGGQKRQLLVQGGLGGLVQLRPLVCPPRRLPDGLLKAGEGGKGAELGSAVKGGHAGMSRRRGVGEVDKIVIGAAHALCPPIRGQTSGRSWTRPPSPPWTSSCLFWRRPQTGVRRRLSPTFSRIRKNPAAAISPPPAG